MKTVRFQQIVAACGRPEIYLTWSDPSKDPTLKTALKQHRVMTLHQTIRGTTKDFGTIGLLVDAHAQILIFPRSLKKFSDRRVVGIDYSVIGKSAASGNSSPPPRVPPHKKLTKKSSAGTSDNDSDNIAAFPSVPSPPKPSPPAEPPITWKEITREVARSKTAFKAHEYTKAAETFQGIADKLRT